LVDVAKELLRASETQYCAQLTRSTNGRQPTAARRGVKTQKVRHQLFLTKELSARLDRIANGTGRARSELLVEALEAWQNRRNPVTIEEAFAARLTRFERHIEAVRRQQGLQWEVLARMLRHQLLMAAGLPPADPALQASALKAFEAAIDEMADRLAGKEPAPASDPGIAKVRRFH
jgi:predicted transcriptional regulator